MFIKKFLAIAVTFGLNSALCISVCVNIVYVSVNIFLYSCVISVFSWQGCWSATRSNVQYIPCFVAARASQQEVLHLSPRHYCMTAPAQLQRVVTLHFDATCSTVTPLAPR